MEFYLFCVFKALGSIPITINMQRNSIYQLKIHTTTERERMGNYTINNWNLKDVIGVAILSDK